ncbi:MAG: hypothetical protein JNL67_09865 [Planctomycetaceae bacterium]|nr:hypothetical protein [Planctomycetaceae bacterium]
MIAIKRQKLWFYLLAAQLLLGWNAVFFAHPFLHRHGQVSVGGEDNNGACCCSTSHSCPADVPADAEGMGPVWKSGGASDCVQNCALCKLIKSTHWDQLRAAAFHAKYLSSCVFLDLEARTVFLKRPSQARGPPAAGCLA